MGGKSLCKDLAHPGNPKEFSIVSMSAESRQLWKELGFGEME